MKNNRNKNTITDNKNLPVFSFLTKLIKNKKTEVVIIIKGSRNAKRKLSKL